MDHYDSPYALIEAALFIEAHPDLTFTIKNDTTLLVSPTEAAREHSARIRVLKAPLMHVSEVEWNRHLAERLIDQMHRYVTHVVLASGMVETLEYVDGPLGAEKNTMLKTKQRGIEADIDRAAEEEAWEALRHYVAHYVAFWRQVHQERIDNEQEQKVAA